MSMQLGGVSGAGGPQMKQKFEQEKAYALSMAQGKPELIAKINAISLQKGAIEELEAIMAQISQSGSALSASSGRTIGIA